MKKITKNPKLFEKELDSLLNTYVWIFVIGKTFRFRTNAYLTNEKSNLFDDNELKKFSGKIFTAVINENTEISFMSSMIEDIKIEKNKSIIFLKININYGEY